MPWGVAAAVAGAVVGGAISSDSSRSAANKQADSVRDSNALQKEMYDQTRADQAPYREAGYGALKQIQNLLQNPGSVANEPDFKFGFDQGTRALNAGAAARGMNYSGAQAKALTRYGTDYANTKLNDTYNRLANVAGIGQVGANGQNNQNYGNNVGNNLIGLGNAQAAATLRTGSTYAGIANQLGALGGQSWGAGGYGPGGSQGYFTQWGSGGGFGSGTGGMGD